MLTTTDVALAGLEALVQSLDARLPRQNQQCRERWERCQFVFSQGALWPSDRLPVEQSK